MVVAEKIFCWRLAVMQEACITLVATVSGTRYAYYVSCVSCGDDGGPLARRVTNVALSAVLSSSPLLRRLSLYWNLNVGDDLTT